MDSLRYGQSLFFVIGCPGAGKGSLCSKLASRWGWAHISVGDELRRYIRESEPKDSTIVESVRSATLVPVHQLAEILACRMCGLREAGYTSFIIDGFPRLASQISHMQDKIGVPDRVIFLDCPKQIAKERVMTRHDTSRTENEEIFERRYAEFCTNNPDIIAHFEAEDKLKMVDSRYAEEVSFSYLLAALEDWNQGS